MIWLLLGALTLLALGPLALVLLRPPRLRGRAEADLALYRAQQAELAAEHAAGRIDGTALDAATTEVQRRILAAPPETAVQAGRRSTAWLAAALALLPAMALGLYLVSGTPGLPSAPHAQRRQQAEAEDRLLQALRDRIAQVEPGTPAARQGLVLLGNAERSRGRPEAAAEAWRAALAARFDADLAGDLAELEIERGEAAAAAALLARALAERPADARLRFLAELAEAGAGRPANARSVWQALLADAPADAPWRALVERQLQALP